jgi:hypothetical protein
MYVKKGRDAGIFPLSPTCSRHLSVIRWLSQSVACLTRVSAASSTPQLVQARLGRPVAGELSERLPLNRRVTAARQVFHPFEGALGQMSEQPK